jgi:hypothetical protein
MPTESSADPRPWPLRVRCWMLLWNFLPLSHVTAVVASAIYSSGAWQWGAPLLVLYLVPPLLCRLILAISPLAGGSFPVGSREFAIWWATAQTQILFNRLPMLEELLRLVPGFYSLWLRLWGAKIGRLTFWAPGMRILDRSFLRVGDDVVTGAGVRFNAHVIDSIDGRPTLHLGEISVRNGCQLGGYCLLTAGCVVDDGETMHAFALLPPFSRWSGGRRGKLAVPGKAAH